jgi:hypothetical protein
VRGQRLAHHRPRRRPGQRFGHLGKRPAHAGQNHPRLHLRPRRIWPK